MDDERANRPLASVFPIEKHAGQRCDAKLVNLFPEKKCAFYFHKRLYAGMNYEHIGTGHARAVKQRIKGNLFCP